MFVENSKINLTFQNIPYFDSLLYSVPPTEVQKSRFHENFSKGLAYSANRIIHKT
jgi:hypothetical protein